MSTGATDVLTAIKPSGHKRRALEAARTILGGAIDVRGYAAGRVEVMTMSTKAWWLLGMFGAVAAVFLLLLHVIVVPGALLLILLYEFVKPKRGVVVTGNGVVEFQLRVFNALPGSVLASTDHGVLYQGKARNVAKGVALTFGSEAVILRARDYAALLRTVPSTPSVSPLTTTGPAAPLPVPPPPTAGFGPARSMWSSRLIARQPPMNGQ